MLLIVTKNYLPCLLRFSVLHWKIGTKLIWGRGHGADPLKPISSTLKIIFTLAHILELGTNHKILHPTVPRERT